MGNACMSTTDGGEVQAWAEQPEFKDEAEPTQHFRESKRTGEIEQYEPGLDDKKPEDDCFEFEEEIADDEIQKFMAVKPWIGAIMKPDNAPEVNPSQPDVTLELEYVYGYRCEDSRQNVFFNPDGNVTYMTACLGVILDKNDNTQKFFGGGEVDNKSKQVASDANHHSNDIMCLKVNFNGDRQWAVTG